MAFIPTVIGGGLKIPAADLAELVIRNAYLAGKIWNDAKYKVLGDGGSEATAIGFPMTGDSFLRVGFAFMEHLHSICEVPDADEGNEFLCTHLDESGQAPADFITAALFISKDGGATWVDVRECRVTDPTGHIVN